MKVSIPASTAVVIPPDGVFKVNHEWGAEFGSVTFLRMNVPPWLMRLILFVAKQQRKR